jgi:alkanesulfonate monooxygenase SsuD/methylene tetrahydromethanopterin reductase-like flavin-dependent oxidoreductase (luciferase family)
MEVGIGLPSTIPGTGRHQVLEWARRAEARGFSTLGTIDRIVYPSHDPLIALAAAAGVTERIRLATAILLAPTRANGAVLAKQASTLDVLSDGRLVLGVAVGRREDDFDSAGVDFHARGRILDEMLELWDRIWGGEAFGDAGGIGPPAPGGRPALLLGGWAPAAFTRAARHADGWTAGNCTLEELADGTARLRAAWEAAGRDGTPRTLAQPYFALGDRAQEAVESSLRDYYGPGDYTDSIVARAATDAATVRENVRAFAAAGCDELIFFPCDPDPDQVDRLADALAAS